MRRLRFAPLTRPANKLLALPALVRNLLALPALAPSLLALSALAMAAALGSCGDKQLVSNPPLDRLFFPTGLALRHVPAGCVGGSAGCATQLVVASSNFDLNFSTADGGTLAVIDADAAVAAAQAAGAPSPLPLTVPGVLVGTPARIGSFAGEVAILDEESCPGWETALGRSPQALVPSRSQTALYRVDLGAAGPSCSGCALPLDPTLADPYGVTVACGAFPLGDLGIPAPRTYAFVTFLRSPGSVGFLTRVDLAGDPAQPATKANFTIDVVPSHSSTFDPASTRLFVTARYNGLGTFAPLRYITLARPDAGEFHSLNLSATLRGLEPSGSALSADRSRLYVGARVYDADLAVSLGARPSSDLAGALLVLDAKDASVGTVSAAPLAVVSIDRGATVVRSLPRPGKRDLVVVTATDDGSLVLYDDEGGAIAQVLALCQPQGQSSADPQAPPPCQAGRPRLGAQPFGLAVERRGKNLARLYVGSFDRGWVNVIDIDPERPEAPPIGWWRIGQERP